MRVHSAGLAVRALEFWAFCLRSGFQVQLEFLGSRFRV